MSEQGKAKQKKTHRAATRELLLWKAWWAIVVDQRLVGSVLFNKKREFFSSLILWRGCSFVRAC